jgi:hypothetical protein
MCRPAEAAWHSLRAPGRELPILLDGFRLKDRVDLIELLDHSEIQESQAKGPPARNPSGQVVDERFARVQPFGPVGGGAGKLPAARLRKDKGELSLGEPVAGVAIDRGS